MYWSPGPEGSPCRHISVRGRGQCGLPLHFQGPQHHLCAQGHHGGKSCPYHHVWSHGSVLTHTLCACTCVYSVISQFPSCGIPSPQTHGIPSPQTHGLPSPQTHGVLVLMVSQECYRSPQTHGITSPLQTQSIPSPQTHGI